MKHLVEMNLHLPTEEEVVPFTMERLERNINGALHIGRVEIGLNSDEQRFVKSIRRNLKEAGFKSKFGKYKDTLIISWKIKS